MFLRCVNMNNLKNTIMFACNQGGHFSQMMALHDLFGKYDKMPQPYFT